jgi:hypothetical protein
MVSYSYPPSTQTIQGERQLIAKAEAVSPMRVTRTSKIKSYHVKIISQIARA